MLNTRPVGNCVVCSDAGFVGAHGCHNGWVLWICVVVEGLLADPSAGVVLPVSLDNGCDANVDGILAEVSELLECVFPGLGIGDGGASILIVEAIES